MKKKILVLLVITFLFLFSFVLCAENEENFRYSDIETETLISKIGEIGNMPEKVSTAEIVAISDFTNNYFAFIISVKEDGGNQKAKNMITCETGGVGGSVLKLPSIIS